VSMLPGESDTAAFVRTEVIPYTSKHPGCPLMQEWQDYWKEAIGYSKLAFLHASGKFVIVNEGMGHWSGDKQTWYSNSSYSSSYSRGRWGGYIDDDESFFSVKGYIPGSYTSHNASASSCRIPTTLSEKKRFEEFLRQNGLTQHTVCAWCNGPIVDTDSPDAPAVYSDGEDVVCEGCVMSIFDAEESLEESAQ